MFTSISDTQNHISKCIICQKPLHFYVAGFRKIPFYVEDYLYCKTKIKDYFLISCNKQYPFKINILTNEILKGSEVISELLSTHLDFYLKCPTCVFSISFSFLQNKLIDEKYLPMSNLLKEELVYSFKNKKTCIHTIYEKKYKYTLGSVTYNKDRIHFYNDKSLSTYIYSEKGSLTLPGLKLNNFKNIKKLNNFVNTLLTFK